MFAALLTRIRVIHDHTPKGEPLDEVLEGLLGGCEALRAAVFYGAADRATTICEVRPPVGSHVLVGEFKVIRALRLLDLNALAAISPGLGGSPFDPVMQERFARAQFLKTLARTLAMPVMPELEQQGYRITQAIAEFLVISRPIAESIVLAKHRSCVAPTCKECPLVACTWPLRAHAGIATETPSQGSP